MASSSAGSHGSAGGRRFPGPLLRPRLQPGALQGRSAPPGELTVALCVPLGGSGGIWGPSGLACARLAVAELNRSNGIDGHSCRLVTVNAADDSPDIEATLVDLVERQAVDALIGMHTSAVRHRILRAVGGHIPFVYTPLYEGGECTPGVFAIGEVTANQLAPAIRWLGKHRQPRRWLAVGNDYVWPHVTHRQARAFIADAGGDMVAETYVPFGSTDFSEVLDQIRQCQADAVLISLVGQDAVEFNRAFGHAGLSHNILRLSGGIGENELLAIGADNTDDLFVSSGYFATLDTDENLAFKARYSNHFGERAPTLSTFGQSTYEGVHFLAALFSQTLRVNHDWHRASRAPLHYQSARAARFVDGMSNTPIYLARAEGHLFRVITRL